MKILANIISPFFLIFIGMALQFALLDQIPPNRSPASFLMDQYGRSLWLTLVVSAYLTASGILVKDTALKDKMRAFLLYGPACAFAISLVLVAGLPKLGVRGDAVTVWLPTFLSAIPLAVAGYKTEK